MEMLAPFGVGFLLLLVERLAVQILPVGPFQPDLVLPFVLFLGLSDLGRVRSLVTAFALGYMVDVFSGAPIGVFAFDMVLLLLFSQMAQLRLFLQGPVFHVGLTIAGLVLSTTVVFLLRTIFEKVPIHVSLPPAIATVVCAPLVFAFARAMLVRRTPARPARFGPAGPTGIIG